MNNVTSDVRIVAVSAGTSDPSSTRLLTDSITKSVKLKLEALGRTATVRVVELHDLLPELPAALGARLLGPAFERSVTALRQADIVIVAAPIYKAGISALLTGFLQVIDDDLLIAKPVILAATAGTPRHSLVLDDQLRSLFAYLRALPVPTSVFAAADDWASPELAQRVDRAAAEAVALAAGRFETTVRTEEWASYQHTYGSNGGSEFGINLDSDLMRLATGGPA